MRKNLGTFQYPVELLSADGRWSEQVSPWVDTGALHSQFPAVVLERLGYRANASRRFQTMQGALEKPVGTVRVHIGDESHHVVAIFAEEGEEMLLGRTTLNTFASEPDSTTSTLKPFVAMMLCSEGVVA